MKNCALRKCFAPLVRDFEQVHRYNLALRCLTKLPGIAKRFALFTAKEDQLAIRSESRDSEIH